MSLLPKGEKKKEEEEEKEERKQSKSKVSKFIQFNSNHRLMLMSLLPGLRPSHLLFNLEGK